MLKIYLAGPDVFETDAIQVGERLKAYCLKYGFEGLFPLDNVVTPQETPYLMAKKIQAANLALIHECDIVIANLNPFRGLEPDSGTVFEVGYAKALNKDVYCYASDRRTMIERIREAQHLKSDAALCEEGKVIENFGLSHNLMMLDLVVTESFEETLRFIKKS